MSATRTSSDGDRPDPAEAEVAAVFERVLALDADEIEAVLGTTGRDTQAPVAPALPPDYEIVGELGRGGMGVVFHARQRSLDRDVAVKVLRPGDLLFGQSLRRFEKEARLLAKLRHPHIVTIHEVGEREGQVYFTMDLIRGQSLAGLLKDGRLTAAHAVKIMRQVASAVAYVHSHGLVHRDLKPANILIDEAGDAVVTDFGLALEIGGAGDMTLTGQVLGTPAYMSPEQARGDAQLVGEATDIYAMGTVLYECLTGRRPFTGRSPAEQVYAVIHEDPPPPRKTERRVPPGLGLVCQKAMRKRIDDRYATAHAFLEDLERFDEGRTVRAEPPSRAYRLGRFARRHAAALAVGVLVTAMLVGLFLGYVRPRMQAYEASLVDVAEAFTAQGRDAEAAEVLDRVIALAGTDPDWTLFEPWARAHLRAASREAMLGDAAAMASVEQRLERIAALGRGLDKIRHWPGTEEAAVVRTLLELRRGEAVEAPDARDRQLHTALMRHDNTAGSWSWRLTVGDRHRREDRTLGTRLATALQDHLKEVALEAIDATDASATRLGWAVLRTLTVNSRRLRPHGAAALISWVGVDRIGDVLEQGVLVHNHPGHGLVHADTIRNGLRTAAPPGTREALAAVIRDEGASAERRRLAAYLLSDLADLPAFDALRGGRPLAPARNPDGVLAAWQRVAGLQGRAAYEERLRIARDALEPLSAQMQAWRGGSTDEMPQGQAMANWVRRHTSYGGGSGRVAAAWSPTALRSALERALADPVADLKEALGLRGELRPAGLAAMLERELGRGIRAARLHNLLVLVAPAGTTPPTWGLTAQGANASLVEAWGRALANEGRHGRVRAAWLRFDGQAWSPLRLQGSGAAVREGEPFELSLEEPWKPFAHPITRVVGLRIPGLPVPDTARARQRLDGMRTAKLTGTLTPSPTGTLFEVSPIQLREEGPGWGYGRGGPSAPGSAQFARVALLPWERFRFEAPWRGDLVVVAFEEGDASVAPWTFDAWRSRFLRDIERFAEWTRSRGEPAGGMIVMEHETRTTLEGLAWFAARVPLPEARAALRALDPGPGWHHPIRFARLMAGDEAPLDQEPLRGWLADPASHARELDALALDVVGWSRLARTTSVARIRAAALGRLAASSPWPEAVAVDLRALAADGTALPPVVATRLDAWKPVSVEIPEPRGNVTDDVLVAVLVILALLALLTVWPGLGRRAHLLAAGWLTGACLIALCIHVQTALWPVPPDTLLYAALALSTWVLEREAKLRWAGLGSMCFVMAAALVAWGANLPPGSALHGHGVFPAFVGVVRIHQASVRMLRRDGRAITAWVLWCYVLPVGSLYGFGLLMAANGTEKHIQLPAWLAWPVMIGLAVSVIAMLVWLTSGVSVRRTTLRGPTPTG